jgi:hypothetical protein
MCRRSGAGGRAMNYVSFGLETLSTPAFLAFA